MSEKKSWDVRPKARPAPEVVPVRFASRTNRGSSRPLKARRRARRWRIALLTLLVAAIAAGGICWCLWQPWLRVETVHATGPHAEESSQLAREALLGTWYGIVPRDSLLFPAQGAIRYAILSSYPDIAAVSILHDGVRGLAIASIGRSAAFLWCGDAKPQDADSRCYAADAQGFIYAYVPTVPDEIQSMASTSIPVVLPQEAQGLQVYGPLAEGVRDMPISSHVASAARMPGALQFAHRMQALGAPVTSIQLRGDEADLYLSSGTRLTYVLGEEQEAATLAQAAFPQLNLTDGSVDYVDLRFDGKVYLKKK